MKAKDIEATYTVASVTGRLIGDIVGSPALGAQIVSSLLSADESPSERNIQQRLREALSSGSIQVKGVGPRSMQRLQSALMLGKALYIEAPLVGTVVDDPAVAGRAFHEIAWEPVEKLSVLALDVKHRILSTKVISVGTATETCAHPRDIFRWLIQVGATRCVVGHNHPSGNVHPSDEDLQLTKQLLDAGKVLGIPMLDHLVVSGGEYISIRETTGLWVGSD
ncbi:MAG: DNA repair protein RadC [Phormidesmis sp. RL_2_1]|nr:DNA repair protein RadC [Phormidesmis sp. RL_2_1]